MKQFSHILSAYILKHPKLLLLLSAILVAFFTPQMKNLRMVFGPTAWFKSDSPYIKQLDQLNKKFGNDENIYLNNFALGEKDGLKEFYITAKSSNSSFNKIKKNTSWLKKRKEENLVNSEDFITKKENIKITTIDNYCLKKKIDRIDLLKIDTQGYEDKVLEGSKISFEKEKVRAVITEIMFDNVYEKYFSFSDIEKHILPYNFRMVGIDLSNNNLFSGLVFFADVYYFNKKYFEL